VPLTYTLSLHVEFGAQTGISVGNAQLLDPRSTNSPGVLDSLKGRSSR